MEVERKLNDVPEVGLVKPPKITIKIHRVDQCDEKQVELLSQTNNASVEELVKDLGIDLVKDIQKHKYRIPKPMPTTNDAKEKKNRIEQRNEKPERELLENHGEEMPDPEEDEIVGCCGRKGRKKEKI